MDLFYRLILILVSILSEWRFLMTSWWQICFPSRAQTPVPAACHRGCSTDNWSQETLTALWTFTCPPSSRPEGRPRSSFSSVVKTFIWFISLFGWDMLERIERLSVFFPGATLKDMCLLAEDYPNIVPVRSSEGRLALFDLSAPFLIRGRKKFFGSDITLWKKKLLSLFRWTHQEESFRFLNHD